MVLRDHRHAGRPLAARLVPLSVALTSAPPQRAWALLEQLVEAVCGGGRDDCRRAWSRRLT